MEFQWWCAAQGQPWSWAWRAYPGVWAAVFVVLAAYVYALRSTDGQHRTRAAVVSGYLGVGLTWLTLDWPLGALGAGYLVSFHALKFLLLAFIIPLLLWIPFANNGPQSDGKGHSGFAIVGSAIFFNLVLISTHTPLLVNGLAESQLGSFLIDALWFSAGLVFWRPVIVNGFFTNPLLKMLYVFAGTMTHTFLGMYLLLSKLPAYTVFELAPRVHELDARTDQGLAGAVMIMLGSPIIFTVEIILFAQWFRQDSLPQKGAPTVRH